MGEYYVFRALVFGWSPACKLFTDVMAELYRVLRLLAASRMTFLIDDQITAGGPDQAAARVRARYTALLPAALKMHLGLGKCQLLPRLKADVLGMTVETDYKDADGQAYCRFVLPGKKLAKLQATTAKVGWGGRGALL